MRPEQALDVALFRAVYNMTRSDMKELPAWEFDILKAYAPALAGLDGADDKWAGVDSSRDDAELWHE